MGKIDPITTGSYYHVFNCGINGTNLFVESKDFEHFLNLYPKYINPIAETFAWCLMNNHTKLIMNCAKLFVSLLYGKTIKNYNKRRAERFKFVS